MTAHKVMKVIKVGKASQSRIAQACDRCRSKKIRCDGVTPRCSQCAAVDFECKTSDQLSRRAFPRGYTESLEERVRSLESELKQLQNAMRIKTKEYDLLAEQHSQPCPAGRPITPVSYCPAYNTTRNSYSNASEQESEAAMGSKDTISVETAALKTGSDCPSLTALVQQKLEAAGLIDIPFESDLFLPRPIAPLVQPLYQTWPPQIPPRLVSDQLLNIFFQDWAPMFPVVDRPALVKHYIDYFTDPKLLDASHAICQIQIILCIAAESSKAERTLVSGLVPQWQEMLDLLVEEASISSLQCFLLAQMYSMLMHDLNSLRKYKFVAAWHSHQPGLHAARHGLVDSNDPAFALRQRVFWSSFALDSLSAAVLGEQMLLDPANIECESLQMQDEDPSIRRSLSVDSSQDSQDLSCFVHLTELCKVLAHVLFQLYPARPGSKYSLNGLKSSDSELARWLAGLPWHLRLQFTAGQSTLSDLGAFPRFLAVVYHYVRILIHRRLADGRETKNPVSTDGLARSSKHIIQILRADQNQHLASLLCLNRVHVLTTAGFGLLHQYSRRDMTIVTGTRDALSYISAALADLDAPGSAAFSQLTRTLVERSSPILAALPAKQEATAGRQPHNKMSKGQRNFKNLTIVKAETNPSTSHGIDQHVPLYSSSRASSTPSQPQSAEIDSNHFGSLDFGRLNFLEKLRGNNNNNITISLSTTASPTLLNETPCDDYFVSAPFMGRDPSSSTDTKIADTTINNLMASYSYSPPMSFSHPSGNGTGNSTDWTAHDLDWSASSIKSRLNSSETGPLDIPGTTTAFTY